MLKKSFLTPVLSGVLAVSVVGSGVLYYVDNKNGSDKPAPETNNDSKTISDVSDNVEKTIETAEKAIKGELDFAYSAKADFTLGKGLTDEIGFDVKPFSVETSTKQKGKKTAADVSIKYDSKNLVSLNSVVDNETQIAYLKVPELSDAYISASADDIEKLMSNTAYDTADDTAFAVQGETSMAVGSAAGISEDALKVLEEIDYEELFNDLIEYVDVIKDNCPEGKDNGKISGDIDGNSYEYTVKTYDVTGQVVMDMVKDAAEKAKNDDVIKDLCVKMGMSESDYTSAIDSMLSDMDADDSELSETILSLDVYYLDDEVTGFATNIDEEDVAVKMVSIESDDVFAIDFSCLENDEGITVKGSAKAENNKVNGKFVFASNIEEDMDMSMTLSLEDLEAKGDMFAGTMRYDISVTADGETVAPSIELTSNSTEDKLDIKLRVTESGTDYVTMTITGEDTDASDITVPSDNIFSLDEAGLEAYLATCNTDAFAENIKSALGDELYTALFEGGNDDYNYEYDYDDYDYDDYDFEDNEDFDFGSIDIDA
ncbi:MAG: hypothetical protein ACI4JA_00945 [Oscillospiraceae bacterium]